MTKKFQFLGDYIDIAITPPNPSGGRPHRIDRMGDHPRDRDRDHRGGGGGGPDRRWRSGGGGGFGDRGGSGGGGGFGDRGGGFGDRRRRPY